MMGSLDPLGMPLATDVLSGERADDGLYIPLIKRLEAGMSQPGLLFVGDCKMSALGTRAYVVGRLSSSELNDISSELFVVFRRCKETRYTTHHFLILISH